MSPPAGRCPHCAHCQAMDREDAQLRDRLRMLEARERPPGRLHWQAAWQAGGGMIEGLSYQPPGLVEKPMIGNRSIGQVRDMLRAMTGA